jgi:hypothetical protein
MAAGSLVLLVVTAVYVVMVFNPAFWNRCVAVGRNASPHSSLRVDG